MCNDFLQARRHQSAVETLEDEVRRLRSSHTDEIKKYKENIALVQDQLAVNREEVSRLQTELSHQQGLTAEAENIAEQWNRDCVAARNQVIVH